MEKAKNALSENASLVYDAVRQARLDYEAGEENSPMVDLGEVAGYLAFKESMAKGEGEAKALEARRKALNASAKHGDPYRPIRRYAEEINALRGFGVEPVIVDDNKIGIPSKEEAIAYQAKLRARALRLLARSADIGYAIRKEGQGYSEEAYPADWFLSARDEANIISQLLDDLATTKGKEEDKK